LRCGAFRSARRSTNVGNNSPDLFAEGFVRSRTEMIFSGGRVTRNLQCHAEIPPHLACRPIWTLFPYGSSAPGPTPKSRGWNGMLIPFFSKDINRSFTTFNVRDEELRSRPMYREPFKTRRCIVPATGLSSSPGRRRSCTAITSRRRRGRVGVGRTRRRPRVTILGLDAATPLPRAHRHVCATRSEYAMNKERATRTVGESPEHLS